MKIIGLFVTVIACMAVNQFLGFSLEAAIVGVALGTGAYILL